MQSLTHQSRNGQLYQVSLSRHYATDHVQFLSFTSLWSTRKGSHVIEDQILSLKGITCTYSRGVPRASFPHIVAVLSAAGVQAPYLLDQLMAAGRSADLQGVGAEDGGCSWLLMRRFLTSLPPHCLSGAPALGGVLVDTEFAFCSFGIP